MKQLPILKQIEWQDLRPLTAWQVAYNVILPYPFLVVSWYFASQNQYFWACIGAYLFYVTAFRQTHDCFHGSLGVSRTVATLILRLMSGLLLSSTHAMKASHLAHHRTPMADDDAEGSLAQLSWWQAILSGIIFRVNIHKRGYQLSDLTNRQAILLDLVIVLSVIVLAFWLLLIGLNFLLFHVGVITLANMLVGFIGVWGLHHDINEQDTKNGIVARTERNRLVNLLTFNLLYHAEHHAFPAVPSSHLPILAKRLDEKLPHLTSKKVLPFLQKPSNHETCPFRGLFIS